MDLYVLILKSLQDILSEKSKYLTVCYILFVENKIHRSRSTRKIFFWFWFSGWVLG